MPQRPADKPLIYLIAGEESGDRLGAPLMAALTDITSGNIAFAGVGGHAMTAQGLHSLFPMQDLAVMGVAEVLPRLPKLLRRMSEVTADIRQRKPDVLVTIDAPDFCFRVARRLSGEGIPLVHYVAPSVWAWRPGRAKKVSKFLDHLLTLLPFEPPYFEKHGLTCTFVGHPVIQSGADKGDAAAFRNAHSIGNTTPVLALLPGSRAGECARLLPVYAKTVDRLIAQMPDLEIVMPTVSATRAQIEEFSANLTIPVHLISGDKEKFDAFAAADTAIAASGTVALELAMAGTPTVICYKMAPLSAFLARKLVTGQFANIINIVLDREAVPEFLLEQCHDDVVAQATLQLLQDPNARDAQKNAYAEALDEMGLGRLDPNRRAAEAVLGVIEAQRKAAP